MAFPAKIDKKKAIAMVKGGLPLAEVGQTFGVSANAVHLLLKRTKEGQAIREEYRANKANTAEQVQSELLATVSAANPKEAQALIISAAILEEKIIRPERGQVTSYTAIDIRALHAMIPLPDSQ